MALMCIPGSIQSEETIHFSEGIVVTTTSAPLAASSGEETHSTVRSWEGPLDGCKLHSSLIAAAEDSSCLGVLPSQILGGNGSNSSGADGGDKISIYDGSYYLPFWGYEKQNFIFKRRFSLLSRL